jgi:hypothetical protein
VQIVSVLLSGGLRYAATTGYFLAALQADAKTKPNLVELIRDGADASPITRTVN